MQERGAIAVTILSLLLIVLAGAFIFFFVLFGYMVEPGYIGVRQIKIGPTQGIQPEGLAPGLHWGLPGDLYTKIYRIPQTVQQLSFNREKGKESDALSSLEIQSADRATVDVDVTILTRFYPSPGKTMEPEYGDGVNRPQPDEPPQEIEHGGPADLLKTIGTTPELWRNHIRRTAEDELKRALGTISTGEFYEPRKRESQIATAHRAMNRALAKYGIRVDAVLLRRYTYREDRIDNAIFQKNLQDQEERLNQMASRLAEAQAVLERVAAEWDAKIETSRVEGDNKATVLRSEGDLYENEKRAQGNLLLAKAKAEVDRLKAEALMVKDGGDIYVAKELAGLLSLIEGGVISDINPYDFKMWQEKLGVLTVEGR